MYPIDRVVIIHKNGWPNLTDVGNVHWFWKLNSTVVSIAVVVGCDPFDFGIGIDGGVIHLLCWILSRFLMVDDVVDGARLHVNWRGRVVGGSDWRFGDGYFIAFSIKFAGQIPC